ncbi:hypothetical protein, partial [Streptomyces sp. CoT10]|uniref:hypothetical protein n=1 Tax=Streptomyces sp. CoT10 TaxID=2875762 RepID=UPI001CD1F1CF
PRWRPDSASNKNTPPWRKHRVSKITGKLHLALSDRPLVTHRAALLGRDLVTSHLKSEPELTCSVMARHVAREPEMLSSHRGQIAYLDAYYQAEYQEEKARAVMDLHRAVLESDVRRTAVVVLELLGRTVPQGPRSPPSGICWQLKTVSTVQVPCFDDPL